MESEMRIMRVFVVILFLGAFMLGQESGKTSAQTLPNAQMKAGASPVAAARAMQLGRDYAADFFAARSGDLWAKMDEAMHKGLKTAVDWENFNKSALPQIGKETVVVNERVMPAMENQVYTRLFKTDALPMNLVMTIAITPDEHIGGFFITPEGNPAPSSFLDYKDKSAYRLPFDGEWTIYQGGRSVYDNYHAAFPDERFAYDVVVMREGRLYSGGGTELAQFFAFGQPIVAPAAGKIVVAVDQYDDNPLMKPSKENPKQGNNIVIDHGNGEFSMMAHLKRGSVKVKAGDTVTTGQILAECGNSGNSPFPHLHYHLQTTPTWFQGDGLPVFFTQLTLNGKRAASAEPVRGDKVKAE